ncbi:MAG: glycosyltransferase [Pseudoalteromonas distincta]|uniref:glycosyltransferase family 2 protein n=1 Tax=Pseudoalteromonas distincta TaxID=77608 RepID=UPI00300293B4
MKLSVCVVTYNHQDYIFKCIESILEQNVDFELEIIIAQDCSTDNTGAVVRGFKSKHPEIITLIDRDKNVGVMQNYEDVFKLAKGEFISFLDGDDYMLPGKLQAQVDALENNHDCNICSHPLSNFDSSTSKILNTPHKFVNDKKYALDDLIIHGFTFSHSSKMFRRSSLPKEIVDKKTENCTDYLLHLQNCLTGGIIHLCKVYGMHRVHVDSLSRHNMKRGNICFALDDQLYALDKISKATKIKSETLLLGYKRILNWGIRKSLAADDLDELLRIKTIWEEKFKVPFPVKYKVFISLPLAIKLFSVLYSFSYKLKYRIKLAKNA